MRLFLASEAKNPLSYRKLNDITNGLKGKKIIYIPTASNGELGFGEWKNGGSWNLVNQSGADITLLQLEDHKREDLKEIVFGKDIIWFAGGACGYLMYWILRTGLDLLLPDILKDTLYVGSSAGSMITGPTLSISEWYIGEEERGASYLPGLGLVAFDIYPHYNEQNIEYIKQKYNDDKLYLLKDGEALIIDNGKVEVFGEERVIFNK